jgi:hypothetical protein
MLARNPPAEIRRVFLGATVRDLVDYRANVQDALRKAQASIFLQEEWGEGAADVVDLSLRRLEESDGYIILLGYRYGSIPTNHTKSVTELECNHALSIWAEVSFPPIFVFLPRVDSDAARDMEQLADAILALECPDTEKRIENKERQKTFRDRIQALGRFCRDFGSISELREWAITALLHYQLDIIRHAEREKIRRVIQLSSADLGSLDHHCQLRTLRRALRAVEKRQGAPGFCAVVHGSQGAGQAEFLEFLRVWDEWGTSAGGRVIAPPFDTVDWSTILTTAMAVYPPSEATEIHTSSQTGFQQLAQALLAASVDEPQVLLIGGIDGMREGLTGFQREFWLPLQDAMKAIWPAHSQSPCVIIVVAWGQPLRDPWPEGVAVASDSFDAVDFGMLLALPELGSFEVSDVEHWLSKRGIKGPSLDAITERVTSAGGTPGNVYELLRTEALLGRLI